MNINTGRTSLVLLAGFVALAFAPELAAPALVGALAGAFAMYLDNFNA